MTRILLVLLIVALLALALWGMYRGWQHRAGRQSALSGRFPVVPTDPGPILLGPETGLYVGSTIAGNWQDRIVVDDIGHRASAELTLHADGVLLNRHGAGAIWLPHTALEQARTDNRLAGKVMTKDGLLVLRWRVGEAVVDTGFRADDKSAYPRWVQAIISNAGSRADQQKDGDSA